MVAAPRTWDELAAGDLAHLDYRQVMARVAAGIDPLGELHRQRTQAARTGARSAPVTTACRPVTKALPAASARSAAARAQPPARRMPPPVASSSTLPMALRPMLASPGRVEMVTEPALLR